MGKHFIRVNSEKGGKKNDRVVSHESVIIYFTNICPRKSQMLQKKLFTGEAVHNIKRHNLMRNVHEKYGHCRHLINEDHQARPTGGLVWESYSILFKISL